MGDPEGIARRTDIVTLGCGGMMGKRLDKADCQSRGCFHLSRAALWRREHKSDCRPPRGWPYFRGAREIFTTFTKLLVMRSRDLASAIPRCDRLLNSMGRRAAEASPVTL